MHGELRYKNKEREQIAYVTSHNLRSSLVEYTGGYKGIEVRL